jgi:hypothetical protein
MRDTKNELRHQRPLRMCVIALSVVLIDSALCHCGVHVTGGSALWPSPSATAKLNSDDELSADVTCAAIIKRHLTQFRRSESDRFKA